jgi:enoyl-CoA hydratase/carnithine racemase
VGWSTLVEERDGPVLSVWLNRPRVLNALNETALNELIELYAGLRTRFDVRVVVLGGRGRAFSAGADLTDPPGLAGQSESERERRHAAQLGRRACQAILDCEIVTVARLHGHVVGGALCLAMACDLRIGADQTRFQIPEVNLGIPLTWGAVPRLISEIGAARARELILLGEPFDAHRAERIGVLHRVVPADELDRGAGELAHRLAGKPEYAIHATKTQFGAYAHAAVLGDATHADGDLLLGGVRASGRLAPQQSSGEPAG